METIQIDKMSDDEYFAMKAISASQIKQYDKGAYWFWKSSPFNPDKEPEKASDALSFGKLCHCMLLEPDEVKNRFEVVDFGKTRTNKKYAEAVEAYPGKEIVTQDEMDRATKMIGEIGRHPLDNSLKNLISMKEECEDNIAFCEIYFSIQYEDERGNMCFQDLIENGNDILVTKDNFDLYIEKRIEYFKKTQLIGVNEIIRGINTIFSVNLLKIFTSDQLGLLINGTPFIDVDDWRLNTQYKNYNDYDNVIINFWDIISNLSQEDLSNFLLFCTGSSRVPIGGFKSLESNRGQISKFEIVKIDYIPGAKNFLRVHTCFNRLDLPDFPDKYSLNDAVRFALENQVLGYGIE